MDVLHEGDSNREEGEISDEDDFENGTGINSRDNAQVQVRMNRSPSASSCQKKSYDGYSHHSSPSPPPFRYKTNKGEYRSNRSSPLQESRRLNTSSHTAHSTNNSNSNTSVNATDSSCFSRGNYASRVDQNQRENDYRDYSRDKQYRYSKSSVTAPQHSTGSWRQRRGLVGGHLNHSESSDSNENLQCDFDLLLQEHARIQDELAKLQREERGLSDISSDEAEYSSSPCHADAKGQKLKEASGNCVGKSSAASFVKEAVLPNSVSNISASVVDKKSKCVIPLSLKKKEIKPVRFKIKPVTQPKAPLALPVSELVEDDESVSEKEESDSEKEESVSEKGGISITFPSVGPHAKALENVSEQVSKNSLPVDNASAAQVDSAVHASMSAMKIEEVADVEGTHVTAAVPVVSESQPCLTSNSKTECDDEDEDELRALALKSRNTSASQQRPVATSSRTTTPPVLNTQPTENPAFGIETDVSVQLNADEPEVLVISGDDEPERTEVSVSQPKVGGRIHSRVSKSIPVPRTDCACLHSTERRSRNRIAKRTKASKRSRSSRRKEKSSPRKSSSSMSHLHKDRANDGQTKQGQPGECSLTRISKSASMVQDKGVPAAGSQKKSRALPFAPVKLDKIKLPPRTKTLREAAKRVSRARAASVARQLPKARVDSSALSSSCASFESKRPVSLKENILEHKEKNKEKKRSENHRQKIAEILEMKDHNEQVDRFLYLMKATRTPTASSLEGVSKTAISVDNYEQVEMEIASDDEMAEALKTDNYQTACTLHPQHYYGHGLSMEYEPASYMPTPWQQTFYLPGALAPSVLACPSVPPLPAAPPVPLPPLPPVEPPPPPPAPEEMSPHHPSPAAIPVVSSTFVNHMSSLVQYLFEHRNEGNTTKNEEQQTLPFLSAISQFLKNLRDEKLVTEVQSHKERGYLSRDKGLGSAEKSRDAEYSLGSHRPYSPSDGDDTFLDRFCSQPNKELSPGGGLLPEVCSQLKESNYMDFQTATELVSSAQTRHFSPYAGTAQTAATWPQTLKESRERRVQAMPSPIHSPETSCSQINSPCSHYSSPIDPVKLVQREAGASANAPSTSGSVAEEDDDENELREQLLRSLALKRREQVEGKAPGTSSRDSSPASLSTPASPQPVTITRAPPIPAARRVQISRPASSHRKQPMMLRMELPVHKPVVVPLLETSSDEEEEEQREPPSSGEAGFSMAIDSFLKAQRNAVTEIQQSSPIRKLSDVRVVEVKTSSPEGSATELESHLRQQEQNLLETQKRIRVDQENLKRLYGEMTKLQNDQRKLELKKEQLRVELLSMERTAALHEKIVLTSKQQVKEAKDKVMQGKEQYKQAELQLLNLGRRLLGSDYLPGSYLSSPSTAYLTSPSAAYLTSPSDTSPRQPEENARPSASPSPLGPISELKRKVHVGETGFGVSVTFRPAHKKRKISTSDKPVSAMHAPKENVPANHSSEGSESVNAKARKMAELHKRSVAITLELHRLRMEADKRAQLSVSVNTSGVRHAVIGNPIKALPAAASVRTPRSSKVKPPQTPNSDLPSLESIKLEPAESTEDTEASHPRRRRSLMDLIQSPKPTLLLREKNGLKVGGGLEVDGAADRGKAIAEDAKSDLSSCFVMPSGLQLSNLGKIQKEKVQKTLNATQPWSLDVFAHINYQCLPISGLKVVMPGHGQKKKASAEASGSANLAYSSPLLMLRAYRFSAYYRIKENLKITSSSFCHKLNPVRVLCRYEMQGTCNDEHCTWQHCRDYKMTEKEILMDLLSYHPALAGVTQETPLSEYPNILGNYIDNFMSRHKETMPIEHLCVLLSARINDAAGNVRPHTMFMHPRPWRPCAAESGTFSLSVTSKFQTSDCVVPSSRASPERDCVLDAEDVRYFSTDSGSGAELQDMEGAVLDMPTDTRLWLRLAYSKLSNPSRPREERLNQALNVLSRGLEINKNSEELWVHYLTLYHQHPDSSEEFLDLCQTALSCAPSYDIWWQVLEASTGFAEKDLVCSRILAFLQMEHDKSQQLLKTKQVEQAQPNSGAAAEGVEAPEVKATDVQKVVSRQPDAIQSHQVLEIILYKAKLNIQSGRFKTAQHFLQKVLGVHKSSESAIHSHLTHSDSCVLWICLVHLTQFQTLPAFLFDPANDNPGRIVSKDNLYIQWGSQEELLPHFDTCLRYLAKPVTLDLSQSLEGCTSPQYVMACYSIIQLWIRVGRPYDALNVLKGIISVVTYVEDLWLMTADLYVSCKNIDNAREVLQMGAKHNPFSARLRYHCAALEMKEGRARPELLEAALEQLEHFVLSFYAVDLEEGKTADPNLLFSKLLGVDVEEDTRSSWKIRTVPPLKKEAEECALKKDLYLWLCFCLLLELQGEDAKVTEVYESALISFTKAADLCQLWKCYVQFLYRLHTNAQTTAASQHARELIEDAMMRSIITMPTVFPVPFQRKHETGQAQWQDFSHVTSLVEFYMHLLPRDSAASVLQTFYDLMPGNVSLLIRCVETAIKDRQMHKARSLCANTIYDRVASLQLWKLALSLAHEEGTPSEVEKLYLRAVSVMPFSVSLWKDFLLFEVSQDNANAVRSILTQCEALGLNIQGYVTTISSSSSKTSSAKS